LLNAIVCLKINRGGRTAPPALNKIMPEGDVDYNGAKTVFCGKEYCISGISDYVERERERKRPGSLYLQVGCVSFLPKPFKRVAPPASWLQSAWRVENLKLGSTEWRTKKKAREPNWAIAYGRLAPPALKGGTRMKRVNSHTVRVFP
jgi:hypothetical protein